jgi:hypothetical protein
MDFKGQNLQGRSFKDQDLYGADFSGADLRGADFTGAKLANALFTGTKTGMRISSFIFIFIISLAVSLLSGYIAMLTGTTIQDMLHSSDENVKLAAYITICLFVVFDVLAMWKGGGFTFKIVLPVILLAIFISAFFRLFGFGTGFGAYYGAIAIFLFVVMFFIGTIARASVGTLSSTILFLVVALGGGMFGKSIGGGIGTVVMALSCAVISKRALKGSKGFEFLHSVSFRVGTYFGTSFKSADLTKADFSNSIIKNTDFTGSKTEGVNWESSKKLFNLGTQNDIKKTKKTNK